MIRYLKFLLKKNKIGALLKKMGLNYLGALGKRLTRLEVEPA